MQSKKSKETGEKKKKSNDTAQLHKGENRHFWKPFPTFHLLHWFTPLKQNSEYTQLKHSFLKCIGSTHYKHLHSQNRDEIGAIV